MCLTQLEKDHTRCFTVHLCSHLFSSGADKRDEMFFFCFVLKLLPAPASQDTRRSLREALVCLANSFNHLPLLRLFAWLAAELTWLPGWLAPFLTGLSLAVRSHAARASLRQGWRETAGLLRVWKVGSLLDFSLCLVWWSIRWEQGKSVPTCPSAQTTDCHYCAASMTLHTWLVYGFGFILVWTLCFARGRWDVFFGMKICVVGLLEKRTKWAMCVCVCGLR